jgi:hypothetical protein
MPTRRKTPTEQTGEALQVTPTMADLLTYWDSLCRRYLGTAYAFTRGKEAKLLQPGLVLWGFATMCNLMDDFFTSHDEFIVRAGKTIPVFVSQLNKLQQQHRAVQGDDALDWYTQCGLLHGHTCNGRYAHAVRVGIDAEKAKRTVQ